MGTCASGTGAGLRGSRRAGVAGAAGLVLAPGVARVLGGAVTEVCVLLTQLGWVRESKTGSETHTRWAVSCGGEWGAGEVGAGVEDGLGGSAVL